MTASKFLIVLVVLFYILTNLPSALLSEEKEWQRICHDKDLNDHRMDSLNKAFHACDEKHGQDIAYDHCSKQSDYTNNHIKDPFNKKQLNFHCSKKFVHCYHKHHNETQQSRELQKKWEENEKHYDVSLVFYISEN